MCFTAYFRSADFQSAVSQNCILRISPQSWHARHFHRPAECNSAIQQIANLRYQAGPCAEQISARDAGIPGVPINSINSIESLNARFLVGQWHCEKSSALGNSPLIQGAQSPVKPN